MSIRRLTLPRLWLLLLALVCAQTLGLVHSALHAHSPFPATASAAVIGVASPVGTPAPTADAARWSWLAHAFSDHNAGECRLFDQLAHGDQAPLPLVESLLAYVDAPGAPCQTPEPWLAAAAAPFDARAPPVHA